MFFLSSVTTPVPHMQSRQHRLPSPQSKDFLFSNGRRSLRHAAYRPRDYQQCGPILTWTAHVVSTEKGQCHWGQVDQTRRKEVLLIIQTEFSVTFLRKRFVVFYLESVYLPTWVYLLVEAKYLVLPIIWILFRLIMWSEAWLAYFSLYFCGRQNGQYTALLTDTRSSRY